jgi:hypothetical protein
MSDVLGRIGRWGSCLVLSLAIGCSSQQAPDSASGGSNGSAAGGADGVAIIDAGPAVDTGFICGLLAYQVPIQAGDAACTILVALPPSTNPGNVKVQDQSMVTIPNANNGGADGWTIGDPQSPILLLIGSYCADAMAGRITSVTILVACEGHPIP